MQPILSVIAVLGVGSIVAAFIGWREKPAETAGRRRLGTRELGKGVARLRYKTGLSVKTNWYTILSNPKLYGERPMKAFTPILGHLRNALMTSLLP